MYTDVQVSGVGRRVHAMIPRSAVQTVGDRQVVYLADPKQPGRFTEREVRLGPPIGEDVEVLSGVQAGDSIVTDRQLLRAGRARAARAPCALGAVGRCGADRRTFASSNERADGKSPCRREGL